MRKKQQHANQPLSNAPGFKYTADGGIYRKRSKPDLGVDAKVLKVKTSENSIFCYLAKDSTLDLEAKTKSGENGVYVVVKHVVKEKPKPDYGFGKRSRIAGIGTFFDFMGLSRPALSNEESPQSHNADVEDEDSVALANDWNMVGSDLTNAVIVYDHSKK
jgi:hypothetical protein